MPLCLAKAWNLQHFFAGSRNPCFRLFPGYAKISYQDIPSRHPTVAVGNMPYLDRSWIWLHAMWNPQLATDFEELRSCPTWGWWLECAWVMLKVHRQFLGCLLVILVLQTRVLCLVSNWEAWMFAIASFCWRLGVSGANSLETPRHPVPITKRGTKPRVSVGRSIIIIID